MKKGEVRLMKNGEKRPETNLRFTDQAVKLVEIVAGVEFMGVYEPNGAEYAAEMAENDCEVSVYKYIPISAIVGWIP